MHVSFDHKECSECAAAHWSAVTHLAGRHDMMHMHGDAQVGMAALSAVWRRFRPIHTDLVYAAHREVARVRGATGAHRGQGGDTCTRGDRGT